MLWKSVLIAYMAVASSAAPVADHVHEVRAACATGLHMLVARGTGADQATGGSLSQVYNAVISQMPGSDASQIVYPANTSYIQSAAIGVNNMRSQIQNYVAACPKSKIVLLGYSQGAIVVGDLLTGNGITGNTQPLADAYVSHIASVVQFADPAQKGTNFFNAGTGKTADGRVARSDNTLYNRFSGKIVEYCGADDYWCASGSGSNASTIHGMAVQTYANPAISFIVAHK